MRRLYAFLTGFALVAMTLPAHARTLTPDAANFTFTVNLSTSNVEFTNTSTIGNEPGERRAFWSFGDGTGQWTGALDGTQHHYQAAGSYNVCLKIFRIYTNTSDSVLSSEICKTVVIESVCQANFETVNSTANPLGKYFIAQPSHSQNKKPVLICWTFGDNHDTCIQYSTTYTGAYGVYHLYSQPGAYNVCVNIHYDGGCEAHSCHVIETGSPDSCRANFETASTNSTPLGKHFIAQPWHNHNKKPVRICWTFGDNRDTCIEYSNSYTGAYGVYHLYSQPGTYNVCVHIRYDGGCEAQNCHPVQVGDANDSCRADFERIPVTTSNNPLQAAFRALPWHNHDKKPVRICWTFGDNTSTCTNYGPDYNGPYVVNHTYANPGNYEVCVDILYQGGCEARKCRVIEMHLQDSCRANFERIPFTSAGDVLWAGFRALPWHNQNKKPARICWSFGDNTDTCINYGADYNGPYTVNHHYQHSGQYEVCVKILYYGGCEARTCKPIVIAPACSVRIYMISPSATGLARLFYAFVNSDPDHPVQQICWHFGDGTDSCSNATASTPPPLLIQHTYPAPGVYHACVRVQFVGGCVAEDCVEVVITSNSHLCGGYMSDSLINPHTFKFKAYAIHEPNDPVVGYKWTFGDGSMGTGQEVTHSYSAGGEYRVCLTILTQSGCETRICKTVRVPPGNNQAILQLSPNPVINILHALFFSTHNETVTIRIVNSSGIVVRTYTRAATIGANNWDFDLATLAPGTYLFVVQSPSQTASALFIKQ